MIADLKKYCFGCILPRCVLDLTTEVQNPTKQIFCNLHSRLVTVLYINTRFPTKSPKIVTVARTVELYLRSGSLRYSRLWRALLGTMSRGRSFCPRLTNDEEPTGW